MRAEERDRFPRPQLCEITIAKQFVHAILFVAIVMLADGPLALLGQGSGVGRGELHPLRKLPLGAYIFRIDL